MDKETILRMSREENEGKPDEREQSVEEKAAQIGKAVGIAVCLLLVFVAEWMLNNGDLARGAWLVFFAMEGSSDLYKYLNTKKTSQLVWAVLSLLSAVSVLALERSDVWTIILPSRRWPS